ncbi:hypothetical protein ABC502_00700 [Alkalimonas sp. NCh-2]|uniref:hypothetical protein n=1 Tax=Alkalimonas sp. NCh-2 TaxID=3144846 RepID=UPI0031F6E5AC
MRLLLGLWCCLAAYSAGAENAVLRMAMPDYPPYTYVTNGSYQGEGYKNPTL